jgi:hypothetical protein
MAVDNNGCSSRFGHLDSITPPFIDIETDRARAAAEEAYERRVSAAQYAAHILETSPRDPDGSLRRAHAAYEKEIHAAREMYERFLAAAYDLDGRLTGRPPAR